MKRSRRSGFFTLTFICPLLLCGLGGMCAPWALSPGGEDATVAVRIKADFDTPVSAKLKNHAAKLTECPSSSPGQDSPEMAAGLDCDGNGGVVQYVTPTTYKVAFKRAAFLRNDGGPPFEVIPDTGTLAASEVLDITNPVDLVLESITSGVYTQYLVEIYYFELTMPMYDPDSTQTIRIYMSDDNFPAEGNLGHHQGDITLIGDDGSELGFVAPGDLWQVDFLQPARGTINGASGADPQTGHLRGLFGDAAFWNQPSFMQGPNQDIYREIGPLDLTVDGFRQTVTFVFNVADSWFYEDFDDNQRFNPCENGTQDGCGGAWAPLFAEVDVLIESGTEAKSKP